METGFLNKHDSEYFSSDATYEQSNGFESEGSFFSSFVNGYNNEFDDYQWGINDEENNLNDTSLNIITNETPAQQDDFNKSFNDWQQHISNLKFREDDLHDPNIFLQEDRLPEIFPSCSPSTLTNPSLPSLLDDPLNPDLLLDELAAAAVIPVSPEAPPAETKARIKTEPDTQTTSNSLSRKRIKKEPIDLFSVDLPTADLLDTFTVSDSDSSCAPAPVNEPSQDLGPDNYDVVDIKIEGEDEEEDEVDIETVTDSMPVIEANDIDSLLDQFEASERVNNMCKTKMKVEAITKVKINRRRAKVKEKKSEKKGKNLGKIEE
uniref:Acyl carrier protein n=1 Tax=Lygus hesperus TaxID=30085 RepID=A0A0A9Y6T0_LYGHE